MSGALQVKNLGKKYNNWGSEWRRIVSWISAAMKPKTETWVLRDVNFNLEPGMAVGIIGQNGAGKSTLLKLISGTVKPSVGEVQLQGRIAAILELGMGFSMELTGRQNAYHSAGLMGYSQAQIREKMPDIEEFAEIGKYFDQPVRVYSSGMQMRVAFSVATAFRPDLLIVDEVLSVGDSYFQHKSFDKIRSFKKSNSSIILVSHNLEDVRSLCDKVILLENGKIVKFGECDEVIDYYNALISRMEEGSGLVCQKRNKNGWLQTNSGSGEAVISDVKFENSLTGNKVNTVYVGESVNFKLYINIKKSIPSLVIGYMIRDRRGHVVWGSNTWHTQQVENNLESGENIIFSIKFDCNLGPGSYSISLAVHGENNHINKNYQWVDNFYIFEVMNTNKSDFIGVNWIDAETNILRNNKLINNNIIRDITKVN